MSKERDSKNVEKLHALLKESIPNRFLNLSPYEFEEFIRQLFLDLGFEAEVTKLTGDFGADILLKKGDKKIAVQVKRYGQNNRVGVQDINQVIGAKTYYGCDDAIFVTTSDFTDQGIDLAWQANIQLWNWDKLHQEIKNVYLDGKSLYEFFGSELASPKELSLKSPPSDFEFTLSKIEDECELQSPRTKERFEGTIVFMKMKNNTNVKKTVKAIVPFIIDVFGNQFQTTGWYTGGFKSGYIYPKASVPLNFYWYSSQVPEAKVIKQIIVVYREEGSRTVKEVCLTIKNNKVVAQEELEKPFISSRQKQIEPMVAEEKRRVYLPLTSDSIGKEAIFETSYKLISEESREEFRFKIRVLGFDPVGKTLSSGQGKAGYEANGIIFELKMQLTNLSRKEWSGFKLAHTLVLEDEDGYQFIVPKELQNINERSYRFASLRPAGSKPFLPKIPVRCSIFFELPDAKGNYRLTVKDYEWP